MSGEDESTITLEPGRPSRRHPRILILFVHVQDIRGIREAEGD